MRLHTVVTALLIGVLLSDVTQIQGAAVLGIDLGSEWLRVGLVKPGVPMEIVLNKETRRKTPMVVYTSLKERLLGEASLSAGIKRPSAAHKYFTRTLGALPRSPLVSKFQAEFPELELQPEEELSQYLIHKTGYSSEELIAMMLNHSRHLSEEFAEYYPIKDVVLTVPPYYTQAQRRALLRSADLVGIKVITLMNTNLAVALHFGSFQKDAYKDKPTHVLFYDMGATASIATVVRYELTEGKSTAPKVTVMGTGFDRNLGGSHVDKLLATLLAVEFEREQTAKNNKVDILNSNKVMAKLLKEAKRVKNVLSANPQHHAHIESLIAELDLKILVKRSDLEDLCELTLFNRIPDVIREALEAAKISKEEIDLVIPVGGSSRLRKVGEIVLAELGKTNFTTTINADESAAMGAVYHGAFLTKGFRIKEIQLQDVNMYPIEISYEKKIAVISENETEGNEEFKTKIVHKQLYYRSNILPQKKVMTFKNITDNLVLHASYVIDLPWLSENDRGVLTQGETEASDIMRIEVKDIQGALDKYGKEEFKGIKVHFYMNENGLFGCTGAEALFERVTVEQSTLDSILGFFSSSSDEGKVVEDNSTEKNETKSSQNTTDPDADKNTSNKSTTTATTTKPDMLIYPLEIITTYLDYPDPSEDLISISKQKLLMLALKDEEKRLLELSQNNLEAFIYDLKERLYRDETLALTSEEQREIIALEIMRVSDWFFEQGPDTPKEEYNNMFKELKSHTIDYFIRLRESKELPGALQKLNDTLNATLNFIEHMKMYLNISSVVFSEGEYTLITRQYNQTVDWLTNAKEEQATLQPYENPSLTVSLVETQRYALESELRYLMNKLKTWRPPPPPVPPKSSPAQPDSNGTDDKDEETSIDIDEPVDSQQQQPEESQIEPENILEQPETSPQEPGDIPQEPGDTPQEPENILEQPEISPQEPGDTSEEPEISPQEPGDTPQEPENILEQPEISPQEPGDTSEEPEISPQEPGDIPQEPENILEQPEISPQEPGDVSEEPVTSPSPDSQSTGRVDL